MQTLIRPREMWHACVERDGTYDGVFVLAVRTTGIFCRPTCPARMPKRENVEFFAAPRDALVAGYRPCRRCRPMDPSGRPPEWVQKLLRRVEDAPTDRLTDDDLRRLSIDPARARRYFKGHYGMTFQAYQRSLRLGSALKHIRKGADLTAVGFDHGFESTSGFREAFERLFGTTPGRSRAAETLIVRWVETPVGAFIAGATDRGVCLFEFADRRALQTQITTLNRHLGCPVVPGLNDHLVQLEDETSRYFEGTLQRFSVKLDLQGTPFQEQVWRELCAIPYGETRSYEAMARNIGRAGACRAVGRANGQNRIAVVIPCHRVIGADGRLCGYGGGLWRKQFLLDLERGEGEPGGTLSS